MKFFMVRHSHRSSLQRPPRRPADAATVTQSSFLPPLLSAFALFVISPFAVSQDAHATALPQATPTADRISPPRHRNFRMPLYPASEREARTTGSVDISMLVSAEGGGIIFPFDAVKVEFMLQAARVRLAAEAEHGGRTDRA